MRKPKVLSARIKDYGTKFHTTSINNFDRVNRWLLKIWDEDFGRNIRLHGDNREVFRKIFGKPSFHFRSEFDFHCWLLKLGRKQMLVLTAKGKGTSYELVNDDTEPFKRWRRRHARLRDGGQTRREIKDSTTTVFEFLKWLRKEVEKHDENPS